VNAYPDPDPALEMNADSDPVSGTLKTIFFSKDKNNVDFQ
jgi:hypothetical protein